MIMMEQEIGQEMRRERTIKINLSNTDCDLLAELCGKYGLTIESVFENLAEDLVDGDYSNGSDERFQITSWFNLCFEYSHEESQKTLLYYLLDQYDVREFLYLIDAIAKAERALEDYKTNAAQYDPKATELLKKEIQDNLRYWKEQYDAIMSEWIARHPEADLEKETENVRKWYREKERMIND